MKILNILSLFLLGLSFSGLALLLLIPQREISARFHRLLAILSASFLVLYGFFHPAEIGLFWLLALILVIATVLALTAKPESYGKIFYLLSLPATGILFYQKAAALFTPLGIGAAEPWLFFTNLVLSSLFLGITLMGMLLGHWYLVEPKLSIAPFQRLVAASIVILILRLSLILGGLYFYWRVLPPANRYLLEKLFSVEGELPFLLQRALFGILLPPLLTYFVWQTVKIRSTQSATGILYVNLVFVLVGELLGMHLTLSTHFLM